jgi:hypothetical protein
MKIRPLYGRGAKFLPWLILGAILAAFLGYTRSLHPENNFGRYHDDTVYFSAAQALAAGQGYTLPSLPVPGGTVAPQSKYPSLYPWLLSWVWRWKPLFPQNVTLALRLTVFFASWFLIASFYWLRSWLGECAALICVALTALHPHFLALSGAVLSEVPFMALAMTAIAWNDLAPENERTWAPLGTGVLAGAATGIRSMGAAVVLGLAAAAVSRKRYRDAVLICLAAAPVVAATLPAGAVALPGGPAASAGWRQTWLYYTSYWAFWKLSVPTWPVFLEMVQSNVKDLLVTPASQCLFPAPAALGPFGGALLCILLTAGITAGIIRKARRQGWQSIHWVLLFYLPVTLVWNYPIMNRFLVPFLPLFYAGAWMEGAHLAGMVRKTFGQRGALTEKMIAGLIAAGLAGTASAAAATYMNDSRARLREDGKQRAALQTQKAEAYHWITVHTDASAKILASEDICLYFYTGRQAVWPIAFTTAPFYETDTRDLQLQLNHWTDVGRTVGARYWLAADGDYYIEAVSPLVRDKMAASQAALPEVFRSSAGAVRIYDLSSWQTEFSGQRISWSRPAVK